MKTPNKTPRKRKTAAQIATQLPGVLAIHPEHMREDVNPLILCVDVSASMNMDHAGSSKMEHARTVARHFNDAQRPLIVIPFGEADRPSRRCDAVGDLQAWDMATLLEPALRIAATFNPHRVVVITDGEIEDSAHCRAFILAEMLDVTGIHIGDSPYGHETLSYSLANGQVTMCEAQLLTGAVLALTDR
jgi:hypothetical protein